MTPGARKNNKTTSCNNRAFLGKIVGFAFAINISIYNRLRNSSGYCLGLGLGLLLLPPLPSFLPGKPSGMEGRWWSWSWFRAVAVLVSSSVGRSVGLFLSVGRCNSSFLLLRSTKYLKVPVIIFWVTGQRYVSSLRTRSTNQCIGDLYVSKWTQRIY